MTVESRVVQMGFDNRQFESGAQTTLKTLESLKQGLRLDESAKSLDNLARAGREFSLPDIGPSIGSMVSGFGVLGSIGFSVLNRLTNAAIDFGKKLVDTVAIAPLKKGFQEYETQMNAIQTVLANTQSKGTTLEQVNDALDELNRYSDKTIYNFTEMTRNIGTFTAAGISLETSTQAIKGIANLAAVSGSNSQQASTAMYQLSQALASGTVKLMDWNSVVNAGMGGQVFQDALKETARVHKVNIDAMIKKEGSFRETLQNGWLTAEILTETLAKFTGDLSVEQLRSIGYTDEQIAGIMKLGQTANDAATKVKTFTQLKDTMAEAIQSGWSQTWRIVIGDFEEAKSFFTEVNDILGGFVGASSEARNSLLQSWKDYGGRIAIIEALRNTFKGLVSIVTPIREAFLEIFPPITAERLFALTARLTKFTEGLILSEETAAKVKRVFVGIASIFDLVVQAVTPVVSALLSMFVPLIKPASGSVLDFLANIGDYIKGVSDTARATKFFEVSLKQIADFASDATSKVTDLIQKGLARFYELKEMVRGWWNEAFKGVKLENIEKLMGKFEGIFGNFFSGTKTLPKLDGFIDGVISKFAPLTGLLDIYKKNFDKVLQFMGGIIPDILQLSGKGLDGILGIGTAFMEGMKDIDFQQVFDIINGGLIAGLLSALTDFTKGGKGALTNASSIVGSIRGVLDGVRSSLVTWQNSLQSNTLMTIATAVAVLAGSLLLLSFIDPGKLAVSVGAVTTLFMNLTSSMTALSKVSGVAGVAQAAGALIIISASILLLSFAVKNISTLEPGELTKGLLGIQALVMIISNFTKNLSLVSKDLIKGAVSLLILSAAVMVLVGAVKILSSIKPEELITGLFGVGAILAELSLFTKFTETNKSSITGAAGLVLLAGSLLILTAVVKRLGEMEGSAIQQGLTGIAVLLTMLAAFNKINSGGINLIPMAAGILILSGSLLVLAYAVQSFASLSWEQLVRGIVGMAAALLLISGVMRLMPTNMLVTAVSLAIISGSMILLAKGLSSLGDMSWEEIARGLVAMGGALLILAIASNAMNGALPGAAAILIVAAAISLLAPALKMIGTMSIGEIATSLLGIALVLVTLGVAGSLLTPLIGTLYAITGVLVLFGLAAMFVGAGVFALSAGLAALAVSGAAGAAALVIVITSLVGLLPMIITAVAEAFITFITVIGEAAPLMIDTLLGILMQLIAAIAELTPPFKAAFVLLMLALISAMVELIPAFVEGIWTILDSMLKTVAARLPDVIDSGFKILKALIKGIRDNIADIVKMALEVIAEFLDGIAAGIPDVIDSAFKLIIAFIDGLADGIDENLPALLDSGKRLAMAIVDGLIAGLTGGTSDVAKAISDLGNAALEALKKILGIASPSKESYSDGVYYVQGFITAIDDMIDDVVKSSKNLGKSAISGLSDGISRVKDILEDNFDGRIVLTPVFDFSEISNGKSQVKKILGGDFGLSASSSNYKFVDENRSSRKDKDIPESGQSTTFNQHIYSPDPIDAYTVYKQTKRLLRDTGRIT